MDYGQSPSGINWYVFYAHFDADGKSVEIGANQKHKITNYVCVHILTEKTKSQN